MRWRLLVPLLCVVAALVAACGGIPDDSLPQPISSFAREGPTNAVPAPQPDMGICQSCVVMLDRGCVRDLRSGVEHVEGERIQTCVSAAAGDCTLDV